MMLANRGRATTAPVTAPPTVPNWEVLLLDRAPLVLVFAVCLQKLVARVLPTTALTSKTLAIHLLTTRWVHAN